MKNLGTVGVAVVVLAILAVGVMLLFRGNSQEASPMVPAESAAGGGGAASGGSAAVPVGGAAAGGNSGSVQIPEHVRPERALADLLARGSSPIEVPTSSRPTGNSPAGGGGSGGEAVAENPDEPEDPAANDIPGTPPNDKGRFVAQLIDEQGMLTLEQKEAAAEVVGKLEALFDKYMPQIMKDRQAQLAAYRQAHDLKFTDAQNRVLELEWRQHRAKTMLPYLEERMLLVQEELRPLLDVEQQKSLDMNLQKLRVEMTIYQRALVGDLMR